MGVKLVNKKLHGHHYVVIIEQKLLSYCLRALIAINTVQMSEKLITKINTFPNQLKNDHQHFQYVI